MPEADVKTKPPLVVVSACLYLNGNPVKEHTLGQFKGFVATKLSGIALTSQAVADTSTSKPWRPPVNLSVIDFLQQHSIDRRVVLLTDKSEREARAELGDSSMFDEVLTYSSAQPANETVNHALAGQPFELIATAATDRNLWNSAIRRYLVETKAENQNRDLSDLTFEKTFPLPTPNFKSLTSALRTYQWTKNVLVLVPLVAAHQLTDIKAVVLALGMFVCFCLVSSLGYVVNDLLDLQSDRAHPVKYRRPFASGQYNLGQGLLIATILFVLTVIGGALLPSPSLLVLMCYLLLTVSYSVYLKTRLMLDVVALGATFTLRVLGGAVAIQSELSFYLLSFSIFLFSSLSMLKRYAELHNLRDRNQDIARGRGYAVEDISTVRAIGVALGCMSAFILGQYINSPLVSNYYDNPQLIWLLFPLLLYWLGRIWILAGRGHVNEDPLIFAMRDNASRAVLVIGAAVVFLAS